jgi:hypothetical protein
MHSCYEGFANAERVGFVGKLNYMNDRPANPDMGLSANSTKILMRRRSIMFFLDSVS